MEEKKGGGGGLEVRWTGTGEGRKWKGRGAGMPPETNEDAEKGAWSTREKDAFR
jgi:hypothetical protein